MRMRLRGFRFAALFAALALGGLAWAEPVECGLLLVKSDPSGSDIEIDGVSVGTTPRLITTLDTSVPHRVTLRKTGYAPHVFSVSFNGRVPILRNEKLLLDSGVLHVQTDPAGAEVSVNGIMRGRSPIRIDGVPKGHTTVRLHLDGYADEVRELKISSGDEQTLSLALVGNPGTINLSSVPKGARIYVNGQFIGNSPQYLSKQPPGTYVIRAELEGYGTVERTVTLHNGESMSEELRLSNAMGRLEVRSSPAGAQVVLDGRIVGTTVGPRDEEFSDVLSIDNVSEGEHALLVRMDGYAESIRHPKIQVGKTSKWNVRLRRVLKPDVEVVTDSGTYTGKLISNNPDYVTVEVKLGVERSFRHGEIRKLNFIGDTK